MELETVLANEQLDMATRGELAKAVLAKATEDRRLALEERRFERDTRLSRWSTPLAVALTGLITIGANFTVDWFRAKQAGELAITKTELEGAIKQALEAQAGELAITKTELEGAIKKALAAEEGARAATAAERSFQYDIMRSELSRFGPDDPRANVKRAEALLFLVRAGLLKGLDTVYLSQRAEITITNAGGNLATLGVPSLRGPTEDQCPAGIVYPEPVFHNAEKVEYNLGVRNLPPRRELIMSLSKAVSFLDGDFSAVIFSAGQPRTGSNRIGSTSHDVACDGYGDAIDFYIKKDGKKIPVSEENVYGPIIEHLAKSFPRIGVEHDSVHVTSKGPQAVWGDDGKLSNTPPWARDAYIRGRNSGQPADSQ